MIDYVRHPSISAQNKGIAEVAALLVNMLGKLGMEVEAVATNGHPMVLGRTRRAPGKPTVLLYGHYDVQPPEPYEAWLSPPFEPTIRDGRIYARGVGDNKGQHFAQLLAIESHLAVAGELPCNVIVLLEGEEEVGSPHIAEFVRAHADRLRADLVVTSDGPMHECGRPTITFGVRGMVSVRSPRQDRRTRRPFRQLRRRDAERHVEARPPAYDDEDPGRARSPSRACTTRSSRPPSGSARQPRRCPSTLEPTWPRWA